jgi:thiol-disulfide isomerase/thioredoxin
MQKPILEELAKELQGKIEIKNIDASEESERTQKEGIWAVPTLIFYDASGSEVFRREGVMRKEEITAKLKNLSLIK